MVEVAWRGITTVLTAEIMAAPTKTSPTITETIRRASSIAADGVRPNASALDAIEDG